MFTKKSLTCFLPCIVLLDFVSARIDIIVDSNSNKAEAIGSEVATISDTERSTFGIDDYTLKGAVETAFGKWPDDVFVHSPTPWGDLYKTYSWKPIERTLNPTTTKMLSRTVEPVIFDSKKFENKNNLPTDFIADLFKEESYSVSHSWTKDGDISSGIKLNYRLKFPIGDSGASMSATYKNNWGNSKIETQPVTIGSISGVKFKLPSGIKATATLTADKVNMEFLINYEASIQGQAALNYALTFQGHHFWGYEVNSLVSAINRPLKHMSSENIKVTYFTNAKIIIKDDATNNNIEQINAPIDVVEEFSNLDNLDGVSITLPIVHG